MSLKYPFLIALFATIITLNGYKIVDLNNLIDQEGFLGIGWKIYNWMPDGQASSSYLGWLLIHDLQSIIHYCLTVYQMTTSDVGVKMIFDLSHWMFCLWILPNIFRFGQFPWYIALIGNGIPLTIILLSHDQFKLIESEVPQKWFWLAPWVYLFGLSMAPFLEIYFLISK